MQKFTRKQVEGIKAVYDRKTANPVAPSYIAFRRTVQRGYDNVAMVEWCGMWLGIEEDGYTHS